MIDSLNKQKNCRVALYCRTANGGSTDKGIEVQRNNLRDFVMKQGFEIFYEYIDNGYNGNTFDRPEFMRMENDINMGKIDTIIVRCIDRITRNRILYEQWINSLNKRGATLIALDSSHEQIPVLSDLIKELKRFKNQKHRKKQT